MNILTDDVTSNRHKNNPQSVEANKRVEPTKAAMRMRIFEYIARTPSGATLKDVCRAFGKLPNEISGRLSEMKALGMLQTTGEIRERCAVLRAVVK